MRQPVCSPWLDSWWGETWGVVQNVPESSQFQQHRLGGVPGTLLCSRCNRSPESADSPLALSRDARRAGLQFGFVPLNWFCPPWGGLLGSWFLATSWASVWKSWASSGKAGQTCPSPGPNNYLEWGPTLWCWEVAAAQWELEVLLCSTARWVMNWSSL